MTKIYKKIRYNMNMSTYKEFLDNGICNFYEGNFKNAIEDFNKSIELNKDFSVTYFYRGASYHSIEEYDEAMLDYKKAISLDPKMTDAYYNRAKIILSRKDIQNPDIKKAIADLEKALELDENFADAMYAMAAAYKKLEDYHKALEYIEKLLKISPEHVYAKALKKLILQKYII